MFWRFDLGSLPYVRVRDGMYQYERRVPLGIQRDARRFATLFKSVPLYRRSLGSKDRSKAMATYAAVDADFERLIADQPAAPRPAQSVVLPTRAVTNDDLQAVARRYHDVTAAPFERLHRRADIDPKAAAELARMAYELELNGAEIQNTLFTHGGAPDGPTVRPIDEARHVVADHGFVAPEGSEQLGAIVQAVRLGMTEGYKRIAALAAGETAPSLPVALKERPASPSLTLDNAVELYLKERATRTKTIQETRLALRLFNASVGSKRLADITRDDIRTFVRHLANQKVGKSEGSILRHLSVATVRKRLGFLASAIDHAKDNDLFTGENLARGIKVERFAKATDKTVMPNKRRFQVSELNLIFQHPWFTGCKSATDTHQPGSFRLRGSEYWAFVVAALTGCRAGELGGLKLSEVRLDDACPHLIVRPNEHRGTKHNRTRRIPVLDALIDLGFEEYTARLVAEGHDRLFPDWVAPKPRTARKPDEAAWSNGRIIRAFNRTIVPSMLGDRLLANARQEVTFHSLRGAFKGMLSNTPGIPLNAVNEVIGHAKSELDERYIGEISIEETYPLVRSCMYNGLYIPRLR